MLIESTSRYAALGCLTVVHLSGNTAGVGVRPAECRLSTPTIAPSLCSRGAARAPVSSATQDRRGSDSVTDPHRTAGRGLRRSGDAYRVKALRI